MDTSNHVLAKEFRLIDRSLEMAEAAFALVNSGTTEVAEIRSANVMLGSGRLHQTAAKAFISGRLNAPKLAASEAKLIDQTKRHDAKQINHIPGSPGQ